MESAYRAGSTKGADARPVAIYLGRTEISTGGEAWVELDEHERATWMDTVRIVYATRDAATSDAQDAARWRYAIKHWLDEHIATKQADAAIAASAPREKT